MFTKSSPALVKTFIVFVFLLLAGSIIAVITLQVSNSGSQDIRSRAALSETVVKEWDFTKGSALGWTGNAGASVSIPPQKQMYPAPPSYLAVQFKSNGSENMNADTAPKIEFSEKTNVSLGIKKFKVWLRVSAATGDTGVVKNANTAVARRGVPPAPKTFPFKFSMQYLKKSGNSQVWSPVTTFTGTTEQAFTEYNVPWSDSLPVQADKFRLVFHLVGANAPVAVSIQKIQIVSSKLPTTPGPTYAPSPTPTPGSDDMAKSITKEGIVRRENPPPPTPGSEKLLMMAQVPNYTLVTSDTTYLLSFDTRPLTNPTTIIKGDVATVSRGAGGDVAPGMKILASMDAFVGCKVTVTGTQLTKGISRPTIQVSSITKTGSCGL